MRRFQSVYYLLRYNGNAHQQVIMKWLTVSIIFVDSLSPALIGRALCVEVSIKFHNGYHCVIWGSLACIPSDWKTCSSTIPMITYNQRVEKRDDFFQRLCCFMFASKQDFARTLFRWITCGQRTRKVSKIMVFRNICSGVSKSFAMQKMYKSTLWSRFCTGLLLGRSVKIGYSHAYPHCPRKKTNA